MSAELSALLRWVQTAMLGTARPEGIEDVIRADHGLSAERRLAIYTSGYRTRLLECLRADYPVLRSTLGADLFDRFAVEYLVATPSRSPSLFDLGAGFADHLLRSRPPLDDIPPQQRLTFDLPVDLARLERAVVEVMRGPGSENQGTSELDSLPVGPIEQRSLRPGRSLRLLEQSHPLADYWRAVSSRDEAPLPEPRRSWLSVSRRSWHVQVHELEGWQYGFLQSLAAGRTVAEASEKARGRLPFWLPTAVARGYLDVTSS